MTAEEILEQVEFVGPKHNIDIAALARGYSVCVGCVSVAFVDIGEMLDWIHCYLLDPKPFEEAYQKACANVPQPERPTAGIGSGAASLPGPAYYNGGGTIHGSRVYPDPMSEPEQEAP